MMNRRHFLGAAGVAMAGSVFAGPMQWSKGPKTRVWVILTGGIWHAHGREEEGWQQLRSGGRLFRRPCFPEKKVRATYGLALGEGGGDLRDQLKRFRAQYIGNDTVEIVSNGQIHLWESATSVFFPMPAHGLGADAASLAVPFLASGHPRVILLHGTDVAHFDMERYFEAESHLGTALPGLSDVLSEQGLCLSVVCLQGRDSAFNPMGGLDHATEEAIHGGWWLEIA